MRIVPFLISGLLTAGLVIALDRQLPVGSGKTPRLGYFLSPQQGFWQNAEPADISFDSDIKLPGVKGKVEVFVDDRLVPHVYADNDLDAYYVQGYLHAKFRLWQMEFQTHVAAGRLSEIVGEERLSTDRFFRRLGMVYGAEQTMAAMENNPEMKATVKSYADGVNAYISSLTPQQLPFEYKLLDYKPEAWTPLKTYLFMMFMAYDLSGRGAVQDLQMTNAKNYFGYVDFDKLFPNVVDSLDPIIPRGTVFGAPSIVPKEPLHADSSYFNNTISSQTNAPAMPDKDNGSNNWAVSGSKTKSGQPILANDPHLGLNLPALWFEMQIHTPTHNTYGASFPGSPAVIIGFNDSIAWGVTNAGRDVIDYYDLRFKDSTMKEYWFNGAWLKAETRKEVIRVKGMAEEQVENIAMTVFGPVMYDKSYTSKGMEGRNLAVRWTALEPGNGLQTFYQLNRAKNYDEYLSAIATWRCPGQNFVFASKTGDIAIKQQGAFVARWKRQGDFVMPGTDSSFMWQGIIPESENPMIKNPASGFVSSANQMVTDASYPYYIGASNNFPVYRGVIINRRLAGMSGITPDDMQRLQMDNYNVFAEMARPLLVWYIDEAKLTADEKKYYAILKDWNLRGDAGEKGATVFKCIWDSLEVAIWDDEFRQNKLPMTWPDPSTLLESLLKDSVYLFADNINTKDKLETVKDDVMLAVKKATVYLTLLDNEGKLEWAKFKDTRVNHLLRLPALSRLHLPIGGGSHMINATKENHGPSWRMIVHMTYDIEAYAVYPGGQSGNPGSRYYDTFVDSWAAGKYYRVLFLRKEDAARHERIKWRMVFNKS